MSLRDPFLADLWRFLRGDRAVAEFEQWIYAHSDELESRLGKQPALEVLASNFRSSEAVVGAKQLLREYSEGVSDLKCRCVTLPNIAIIDMGEESEPVLATIEERRSRGDHREQLSARDMRREEVQRTSTSSVGGLAPPTSAALLWRVTEGALSALQARSLRF
jgi:hypothetical protein